MSSLAPGNLALHKKRFSIIYGFSLEEATILLDLVAKSGDIFFGFRLGTGGMPPH